MACQQALYQCKGEKFWQGLVEEKLMGRGRVIMAELSSTIGALGNLGLRNFKVLLVQENVIGAIIRRPKINRSPEHG